MWGHKRLRDEHREGGMSSLALQGPGGGIQSAGRGWRDPVFLMVKMSMDTVYGALSLLAVQEDMGLIPGSERSPGRGNGNLLQYSSLENPMDRGAWRDTV